MAGHSGAVTERFGNVAISVVRSMKLQVGEHMARKVVDEEPDAKNVIKPWKEHIL